MFLFPSVFFVFSNVGLRRPWEGGTFKLELTFTEDYPNVAPRVEPRPNRPPQSSHAPERERALLAALSGLSYEPVCVWGMRARFRDFFLKEKKCSSVKFVTRIFHPNIYNDGQICLDILQNQWSPIYDISAILTSIQSLLSDPNPASPANSEASRLRAPSAPANLHTNRRTKVGNAKRRRRARSRSYSENRREYNRRVREVVEQSWQDDADAGDDGDDD